MDITLNASSRIMHETAQKMGITCTLIGDSETIFMEKNDQSWYTRGSRTSLQSSVGKSIADNKALTKLVLQHYNLPTAKSVAVSDENELSKLSELLFPIVMKPLDERHGKGVIVNLPNIDAAKSAYRQQAYTKVIFEEMLEGLEYRIVCVDFEFVAAAFRKPAHVVGDGEHTIEQLIAEKNKHPWRGQGHTANLTYIEADETVLFNLREIGCSLVSVPDKGTEVLLRHTANLSTGGEAWDVSADVCLENQELFRQIAKACDLNVAGIDIMCQTLKTPIRDQVKAGVIEVNASPGLRMHHYPIKGTSKNVAEIILNMVLNQKQGRT